MLSPLMHALLDALRASRFTHVFGIPDNDTAALFDALGDDAGIRLVAVSREGEAIALASGVWVGGGRALVVIQNTGLLESGDALRGTALRMRVPLVMIVGYRGFAKMTGAGIDPVSPFEPETLSRPDVDSAALFTEPTLHAWSVPAVRCDPSALPVALREAWRRARDQEMTQAILLTGALR